MTDEDPGLELEGVVVVPLASADFLVELADVLPQAGRCRMEDDPRRRGV